MGVSDLKGYCFDKIFNPYWCHCRGHFTRGWPLLKIINSTYNIFLQSITFHQEGNNTNNKKDRAVKLSMSNKFCSRVPLL